MLQLIINDDKNKKRIMLIENGVLVENHEENHDQKRIEGNIYVGIVQNVLPGMQAAFVNIGENRNAFIKLQDALPKNFMDSDKSIRINEVLSIGKKILVQIKKDGTLNKGAKVSTHINLAGRFLVLMPNTNFITISQKIENEQEIERLKKATEEILPKEFGAIIRTSAEGISQEELKLDLELLIEKWKKIEKQYNEFKGNKPNLLYNNKALIRRTIMDVVDKDLEKIVLNSKKDVQIVENIIEEYNLLDKIKIEFLGDKDLRELYDLKNQLKKMEERKVWLECGGFITIDKTEALTAIDVNSGKYIGKKNVQDTIFKVNKEATQEIAKQLRLRDIGGIIIIDYIDMEENQQQLILEILSNFLKKDRTKTQIVGFTKLNLLEMTRKKLCNNDDF